MGTLFVVLFVLYGAASFGALEWHSYTLAGVAGVSTFIMGIIATRAGWLDR